MASHGGDTANACKCLYGPIKKSVKFQTVHCLINLYSISDFTDSARACIKEGSVQTKLGDTSYLTRLETIDMK